MKSHHCQPVAAVNVLIVYQDEVQNDLIIIKINYCTNLKPQRKPTNENTLYNSDSNDFNKCGVTSGGSWIFD